MKKVTMSIIINTVKGHPNDELITTLRRKVSAYASQNRAIFIGTTFVLSNVYSIKSKKYIFWSLELRLDQWR